MIYPVVEGCVRVFIKDVLPQPVGTDMAIIVDVSREIQGKIEAMPFLMRTAVACLTIIFDWSGIVYKGRCFHAQEPIDQERLIEFWLKMPRTPMRDVMRFYQKMSVHLYYALRERSLS